MYLPLASNFSSVSFRVTFTIRPLMTWGVPHSIRPLIIPEPPISPIWLMERGSGGRFTPLSSSLRTIIRWKLSERLSCRSNSFSLNFSPRKVFTSNGLAGRG